LLLSPHDLLRVRKPARYVGGELGAVVRNDDAIRLRFALCFPDVYEIAMSHLGSQILYSVLNCLPRVACERVHAPWPDYADLLREKRLRLHSLETGRPLHEFDIVGFSLQTETCYPTVLWMLDLGGVKQEAGDREDDPLVIVGGPCAVNPEPLAPFIDAAVVGDGEDVIVELCDAWLASAHRPRAERVADLAGVESVYVPALGTDRGVRMRKVRDLDAAPYPRRPILPHIEAVHDRVTLEIARGCTRGCRFCQAGAIDRPARFRSADTLKARAREHLAATGHEEVSLLSLSAADYPGIEDLCHDLAAEHADAGVGLALPSTRVDAFSVSLAKSIGAVRRSGITLAPEAGTQRLRDVVNKQVSDADIMAAAEAAFASGFELVKLYFMLGLPTETDEDAEGIADIIARIAELGRRHGSRRGKIVTASLAAFVPKPHTPFQWEAQADGETLDRRRRIVTDALRRERRAAVHWHDPGRALLECALARGGRETAEAVRQAYLLGARLDGWDECFSSDVWVEAFRRAGLGLNDAARALDPAVMLPWDHIRTAVSKEFLLREAERARQGLTTADCAGVRCHGCGAGCNMAG